SGNDVVLTATQVPAAAQPPAVTSVVSRKTHGAAGTFDLTLAQTPANPTTEPRGSGNHQIVFAFDKPVILGTASVTERPATTAAVPIFNGNEMIVDLSGVSDMPYVTVAISSVMAGDGGIGSGSIRIGFLTGDANGSRSVTLSDMIAANAVLTQPVTSANFTRD